MEKPEFIEEVFSRLSKSIDNPVTELNYTNPYTLLVAVVLSAQSTDKGVNKATSSLFELVSTPYEMIKLGEDGLKNYIKTIGLYNNKAKNIITFSKELVEKYQGRVPSNRQDLMSLPGVGRKTANVVLNVAYQLPTIPVDTHVARVAKRLELTQNIDPDKIEHDLEKIIPKSYLGKAHHLLILHGRYVCKAQRPLCKECTLASICPSASL